MTPLICESVISLIKYNFKVLAITIGHSEGLKTEAKIFQEDDFTR